MLNGRNNLWFCHSVHAINQKYDLFSPKNGRPFRCVKYSPIFESNLAPLIRADTVHFPRADLHPRAEMGLSEGWNSFFIELFCAQMAPGRPESSDFGLQVWIGTMRLKQIFIFFQFIPWISFETFFTRAEYFVICTTRTENVFCNIVK